MMVVGLVGKKQSGKDTACKLLGQLAGDEGFALERMAFADELKLECAAALGQTVAFMDQHKDIFRPFYQWYGTEYRRELFGRDYWIKKAKDKLKLSSADVVVFTDVRFHNEADLVREAGGLLLRIVRPDQNQEDGHQSETELDRIPCDFKIINDLTIDRLRSRLAIIWDLDIRPDEASKQPVDNIVEV